MVDKEYPDWHPAATGAREEKPGETVIASRNSERVGTQYTGTSGKKASFGANASGEEDRGTDRNKTYNGKKSKYGQRRYNTARKKGFRKPPVKYLQNSPFAPAMGASAGEEEETQNRGSLKTGARPAKRPMFREDSRLSQPDTEEDLAMYALHGVGVPGEEEKSGKRKKKEPESEFTKAKNIVLNQLAMAPRSRAQLAKKLADREISEETAEDILSRFEAVNLINDAEFAEVYVRTRANVKKLSKNAIRRELKQKGVEGEAAEVALEQRSDEDERSDAHALVAKKLRPSMDFSDRKEKDKIMRRLVGMLARKGYPPSMAFGVVKDEIERYVQENGLDATSDDDYYF